MRLYEETSNVVSTVTNWLWRIPFTYIYQLLFLFVAVIGADPIESLSGIGGLSNEFVDTVIVNVLDELMNLCEEFVQIIKSFCELLKVADAFLKDVFDFPLR